jgi:hypothetical protein
MAKDDISNGGKSDDELLELALKETPKNEDGSQSADAVIENLAEKLTINVAVARLQRAKRIFDRHTKVMPGEEVSQQMSFEGFAPQAYKPDRIVLGPDGTFMLLAEATLKYIQADAQRSRKHANESGASANFKQAEAAAFAQWVVAEMSAGRRNDLTFGRFVQEGGFLSGGDSPSPVVVQ